jgi:putative ABC transport system permease protein
VSTSIVLRATDSLTMLPQALRATVASLDPDTPVDRVAPLESLVSGSAEQPRLLALVFSAFGLTGLLLGALGIYGVTADGVARRRHEIGVRVALGAGVSAIRRLIVRESLGLALAGIVAGIAAALLLSRGLEGLLFGVEPTDPVTWAAVGGLLVGIALLSSLLPARRASRVDPLIVLRQ